ncbi:MAG: hypothetical protein JWL77_6861, partial [Chthonomonadaceae bacterium]|nr:hypothetical protein [Chthonomonadaceae bacterium]
MLSVNRREAIFAGAFRAFVRVGLAAGVPRSAIVVVGTGNTCMGDVIPIFAAQLGTGLHLKTLDHRSGYK